MRRAQVLFGLLTASVLCLPVLAQSRRISSNSASPNEKFAFYVETHLDPATPELANVSDGIVCCTSGVIHRFMADHARRVYFGYDVSIEALAEPNTYRVTFSSLTLTPKEIVTVRDDPAGWSRLSTPGWGVQTPRTVRGGDVLTLNLLTNNATGQKITDYVTIQEPPRPRETTFANVNTPPREFAFAEGPARDFRVDDAQLRIRGPRLSVNGKFDSSTMSLNTEVAGAIVWFYAPNRGRFLLALSPQPGFQKAGEVRGTTLNFAEGGDAFSLVTGAPIAPGNAAFNLYVLHDQSWRPAYPNANTDAFILGAADEAQLLRR